MHKLLVPSDQKIMEKKIINQLDTYIAKTIDESRIITFFFPSLLTLSTSSGLRDKFTTPSDKSTIRPFTDEPTFTVLSPTAEKVIFSMIVIS